MSRYEVYKDEAGEHRWRLIADNGEKVAQSESYTTKADAERGVEAAKNASLEADTEEQSVNFLDDLPLASLVAIASIAIIVIAYISNDLNVDEALLALGAAVGGSGVLGIARAQSGKGMRTTPPK